MAGSPSPRWSSRRIGLWAIGLGLFVLLDLCLFGWLLFRSLSQREIDRLLLETQQEAQDLAGRIAGSAARTGGDLFTAVVLEQEAQTYIDSVLRQRQLVQTVEIRDRSGVLVMKDRRETQISMPGPAIAIPPLASRAEPPRVEIKSSERQASFDVAPPNPEFGGQIVSVPIGDFGSLEIGISQPELERRVGLLRRDLTRQTAFVASVTLLLLIGGFVMISTLLARGRRLEEQAAEAERLAYLGTLAAGLAHEIRNPLNSLSLNMQMLEEDLATPTPPTTHRRLIALTRSEIGRLERLVTDFLAYARPRALRLEEVAPATLLEAVRDLMAAEIVKRGARVEVEDAAQGAAVRVDAEQLRQLLINLVQNALAATEESPRPPLVRLSARRAGPRIEIAVADNGVGLDEATRAKMFDLFYSTRKGGTGLGLAIVDRIARAHAAEISVDPSPGGGTTFRIGLPVARAAPARTASA